MSITLNDIVRHERHKNVHPYRFLDVGEFMSLRTMYDAINPDNIPTHTPDGNPITGLIAGYIDSDNAWPTSAWSRWSDHAIPLTLVRIARNPATNAGDILDLVTGTATNLQALTWVHLRRLHGADPTLHCTRADWSTLQGTFRNAGVRPPHWWIADWTGRPDIPLGAVACQYADTSHTQARYRLSVAANWWPGIDPPTSGATTMTPPPLTPGYLLHDPILTDGKNTVEEALATLLHEIPGIRNPGAVFQILEAVHRELNRFASRINNLAEIITHHGTKLDQLLTALDIPVASVATGPPPLHVQMPSMTSLSHTVATTPNHFVDIRSPGRQIFEPDTFLPTTPATQVQIGPEATIFIESDGTVHAAPVDEPLATDQPTDTTTPDGATPDTPSSADSS